MREKINLFEQITKSRDYGCGDDRGLDDGGSSWSFGAGGNGVGGEQRSGFRLGVAGGLGVGEEGPEDAHGDAGEDDDPSRHPLHGALPVTVAGGVGFRFGHRRLLRVAPQSRGVS